MVDEVLIARGLSKVYGGRRGQAGVEALTNVSLTLERGRTLGIVGESGCGKSTLARLLVGLEAPSAGEIVIDGERLSVERKDSRRRARKIQLVFQDPFSSLDPRCTVENALSEVLKVHGLHREHRAERVVHLLSMVGLSPRFAARFPHELSGGQAQRVAVARALAVEPEILVLDEPTSALDVSVRAEIINLLVRIQDELGLSYLFISHDLSMVRHISDTIAVMYLGRVVERGRYDQVLESPLHPYSRALANAIVVPDPTYERSRERPAFAVATVATVGPMSGCPYATRCAWVEEQCRQEIPTLCDAGDAHEVACPVTLRAQH